jgi:hypothetical protein
MFPGGTRHTAVRYPFRPKSCILHAGAARTLPALPSPWERSINTFYGKDSGNRSALQPPFSGRQEPSMTKFASTAEVLRSADSETQSTHSVLRRFFELGPDEFEFQQSRTTAVALPADDTVFYPVETKTAAAAAPLSFTRKIASSE